MPNIADAFVRILADRSQYDRQVQQVRRDTQTQANFIQGIWQGVGQAAFRAVASGMRAVVGEIGKAITAASDLSESVNKTGVVFGDSAAEILEWSKTSATAFGQSRQQALEAASGFGNLFVSMGVTRDEAATMSRSMVELASDIASLNNLRPEEALEKLRAGLVGETEPLRTVGVLLNQAAVEAKAAQLGFSGTNAELTESQKVLARYNLILDQTVIAQGDFARTSQGVANQQRILTAQLDDFRATLGGAFTPVFGEILRGLNELIRTVRPYGENLIASFASGMANAINTWIIPLILNLRAIFTFWLRGASPPRLLPDLAKWGASAVTEYLKGWTQGDFSALDTLARQIEGVLRSFVGAGKVGETDLVSMVFGSRDAIARAVSEFRRAGTVSESALRAIEQAAGPAGESVSGLVRQYFNLQNASRKAADAQDDLTRVTERYDALLSPLQQKVDALRNRQQELRDQERLAELGEQLGDVEASAADREQAQLEIAQIRLEQQMRAIEEERDTAVDSAKAKIDATKKEEEAAQEGLTVQQSIIEQQINRNNLIAEEINLRNRLADEALAAQEKAQRELEAAQREAEAAAKKAQQEAETAARKAEQEAEQQRRALEQLYQAQLSYNLTVADTPGKIALLRLELERHTKGSVEYWNILGEIATLEQQLAREREAAAKAAKGGAGILPTVEALGEINTAVGTTRQEFLDLEESIRAAMAAASGAGPDAASLSDRIRGTQKGPQVPFWLQQTLGFIKDVITELGNLDKAIDEFRPNLTGFQELAKEFAILLAVLRGEWKATHKGIEADTDTSYNLIREIVSRTLRGLVQIFEAELSALGYTLTLGLQLLRTIWESTLLAFQGKWTEAWDSIVRNLGNAWDSLKAILSTQLGLFLGILETALGQTPGIFTEKLMEVIDAIESWAETHLYGAGTRAIRRFWDGAFAEWAIKFAEFIGKLNAWRALLPFSEPKDPSSPLRGLEQSGEAAIANFMRGMERAASQLRPAPIATASSAGMSSVTNNYYQYSIDQTLAPFQDVGGYRQANKRSIEDVMRAKGIRPR